MNLDEARTSRGTGRVGPLLTLALTACSAQAVPLTDADRALLAEVGLGAPEVVAAIESVGGPLERFYGLDDGGLEVPGPGVALAVEQERVTEVIAALRAALAGRDIGVYLGAQNFGFEPDEVAVLVGDDPYDFLRLVRVDGINYDKEHEDVVAQLRAWDEQYGLDFLGGGLDWVQASFRVEPDYDAFAVELYGFCPDVVDQGAGSIEALARELRRARSLYCWWD